MSNGRMWYMVNGKFTTKAAYSRATPLTLRSSRQSDHHNQSRQPASYEDELAVLLLPCNRTLEVRRPLL